MKVAACITEKVSHVEEWVTVGDEGGRGTEKHMGTEMTGAKGEERREKGGQREGEIRSKRARNREGPRDRQVRSRALARRRL